MMVVLKTRMKALSKYRTKQRKLKIALDAERKETKRVAKALAKQVADEATSAAFGTFARALRLDLPVCRPSAFWPIALNPTTGYPAESTDEGTSAAFGTFARALHIDHLLPLCCRPAFPPIALNPATGFAPAGSSPPTTASLSPTANARRWFGTISRSPSRWGHLDQHEEELKRDEEETTAREREWVEEETTAQGREWVRRIVFEESERKRKRLKRLFEEEEEDGGEGEEEDGGEGD